nr:eukaryotic translation initiation factor 5B-like [Lolium perenne]
MIGSQLRIGSGLSHAGEAKTLRNVVTKEKRNRSRQKVMHTAGSKSYARIASEMHKENGYAPRRDELFLRTHSKRKDGTPIDKDTAKIISDIEEAIETNPELLEKTIEQGDVLAHVLGKEKNGYVRCVGMGPSPGRLGIPGGQKLKSTKLQMAEEETKEAWRANDVLKEHVEEIREETKSKIDGLMEEIDLLKWMMAQTIAANNKTKSIEREPEDPEGSVGESYAIEDHCELDDEEERVQQEMRKAKEYFEKKQEEVQLLQKKKKEAEILQKKKEVEILQKKKEAEVLQMKGVALNQNKEDALARRMKDAEGHQKNQETLQKKDAETRKKPQKEAAVKQRNHQVNRNAD